MVPLLRPADSRQNGASWDIPQAASRQPAEESQADAPCRLCHRTTVPRFPTTCWRRLAGLRPQQSSFSVFSWPSSAWYAHYSWVSLAFSFCQRSILSLSDVFKMVRVGHTSVSYLPACKLLCRSVMLFWCWLTIPPTWTTLLCRAPDLRQPHGNERPNGHLRQGPFGAARVRRPGRRRREPPRPARSARASPSLLSTCSTSTGPVPPPSSLFGLASAQLCPLAHPPTSQPPSAVRHRTCRGARVAGCDECSRLRGTYDAPCPSLLLLLLLRRRGLVWWRRRRRRG
jgi:hypothetical protein